MGVRPLEGERPLPMAERNMRIDKVDETYLAPFSGDVSKKPVDCCSLEDVDVGTAPPGPAGDGTPGKSQGSLIDEQ